MTPPIHALGLHGTFKAYQEGLATPSEVLGATLDRVRAVEPKLNAFACLDEQGAREAAAQSDIRWAAGRPLGPLDGAIISIKDNLAVANLPCRWGSEVFAGYVPSADELPVARLRKQGAIFLGKTNVSEFTLGKSTVSTAIFGTTRNPWNPDLTTGASSGGAAAAVASGMGSAALATDGGGSIRRPASHCGLVGLKPGLGRVARQGGLPMILGECEVVGSLARSVGDAAHLYRAIALPDASDRLSWPYMQSQLQPAPIPGPRILYVAQFGDHPVDAAISWSCSLSAERLRRLGCSVEIGQAPFDIDLLDRSWSVFSASGFAWMLRGRDWQGKVSEFHARVAKHGNEFSAADYVQATAGFKTVAGQLGTFFQTFDFLMTPAVGALPWKAEEDGPPHERAFTRFANVAGIPALTVPGEPHDGLPIGFQLAAPYNGEEALLAIGEMYENAYPWADRWPDL